MNCNELYVINKVNVIVIKYQKNFAFLFKTNDFPLKRRILRLCRRIAPLNQSQFPPWITVLQSASFSKFSNHFSKIFPNKFFHPFQAFPFSNFQTKRNFFDDFPNWSNFPTKVFLQSFPWKSFHWAFPNSQTTPENVKRCRQLLMQPSRFMQIFHPHRQSTLVGLPSATKT